MGLPKVSLPTLMTLVLMYNLSFPQRYEPFIFLSLKFLILVTELCLEIENVLKFDILEACKGTKAVIGLLGQP